MEIQIIELKIHDEKHKCGNNCEANKKFFEEFEFFKLLVELMKRIDSVGDKIILGELYCNIVDLEKSLLSVLNSHKRCCSTCPCEEFKDQKRKIQTVYSVRKYIADKISNRTVRKKIETSSSLFTGRGCVPLPKTEILDNIKKLEESRISHVVECKHCFHNSHPIDGKREGKNAYGCSSVGGGSILINIETYRKQLGMYYPEEYKRKYGKVFEMIRCKQ